MDQGNHDWIERLIKQQDEHEKDVDLGPAHLEKTISKKQHESFLPQKELGVNTRRKDSGTKATESKRHEYKRDDARQEADFKKKRERVFEKQDIEAESMEEMPALLSQVNEINESEGLDEFRFLAKGKKEVEVKDETEFSDGWRADGSYADGYWREPSAEDLRDIEAEGRRDREQARRIREFNESSSVKSGSQKVRKVI